MNRNLFTIAFLLGAAAVVWVGAGFMGAHGLALTMTLFIGAVYGFGALELHQFRQASATLARSLTAIPDQLAHLGDWLDGVHPSLQNFVRLRIEGERTGLPGPALTPYLVGLLVMLGMLGTFLGMVVTLNGAAFSLEGTTDLQAIRTALAAPIKGLGLAFGTSVAGVATSAMLGLMSALSRRERMLAAQQLDTKIATSLRGFSLTHQRQQAYTALQVQAHALPEVVDQLQAMMAQMERMSQQLNERLLTNQESFHGEVKGIYSDLAASVDKSLKESLTQSAQVAGESLKPVVEAAMTGMAKQASLQHERVSATAQRQLDGLSERLSATAAAAAETWTATLTTLQADQASNDKQRLDAWSGSLQAMAAGLHHEWQETGAQTLSQQQEICRTLTQTAQQITEQAQTSASHTLGEITRLMAAASEAPRAAAEVIGQLRREMSSRIERDNELLEERARILKTLNALLEGIDHASAGQRAVIDALVTRSAEALNQTGGQFSAKVELETAKLSDIAAHVTSSAVDVASLGESFGFAVNSFNQANEKLIGNLQRIEAAMDKSMARSDDQLAYYVGQAREVIDLSIMSQREIFEELRQLPARRALSAEEVN